jgi:hypothetical protein
MKALGRLFMLAGQMIVLGLAHAVLPGPSCGNPLSRFPIPAQAQICLDNVPDSYREHPNFDWLIYDPARNLVSPQTVREAMAGIEAIKRGYVPGPITRPEDARAREDFNAGDGTPLDIKTPPSKRNNKPTFDLMEVYNSVLKKLSVSNKMLIILDTTYLNDPDRARLMHKLDTDLKVGERRRIFELTLREPLPGIEHFLRD